MVRGVAILAAHDERRVQPASDGHQMQTSDTVLQCTLCIALEEL